MESGSTRALVVCTDYAHRGRSPAGRQSQPARSLTVSGKLLVLREAYIRSPEAFLTTLQASQPREYFAVVEFYRDAPAAAGCIAGSLRLNSPLGARKPVTQPP